LEESATKAVTLDDRDAYSHYAMFTAHMFAGRPANALASAQRAIDLNPNFALGHLALGWARVISGNFTEALTPLHAAIRLSPHDPLFYLFLNWIALAHYHLGNHAEAAHHAGRAAALRRVRPILVVLLASLGQLGETAQVQSFLPDIEATDGAELQQYLRAAFPYAHAAHRDELYDGLRKAGLSGPL